jgi:hypothetical protein
MPRTATQIPERNSASQGVITEERNDVDAAGELILLGRARRIMPADPARALALADEHRARYRVGILTEERELLAVEALLRLKRRDEAEQRGRAFARTFPNSVQAPRVRTLLQEGVF